MAVFTYQLVYYGWTKLEMDELREEADGASLNPGTLYFGEAMVIGSTNENDGVDTLKGLEAQVEEYKAKLIPKKS